MRLNIVVWAYTFWLVAIFGALYVTHGENPENALQLALVCGVIPGGLQLLLLGVEWHGLVAPTKMWLVFLLIVLLSYLVGATDPQLAPGPVGTLAVPPAWTPLVYTVNVVFILGIGTLVAGCPDRRLLRSIAGLYCVLLTPFLVYVDLTGARVWGNRLEANGLQANMWGGIGLTVCLAALARKPGPIAVLGFATGMATILAADSRECLLAVAAALLVIGAENWRAMMKRSRLLTVLAGTCAILVVAGVLLDPYVINAIHYISADVLALNDPNRGVNSGFTGRTGIWAAAFDVWLKSPLLGVGYRQHERFLPDGIPGHNAYLAMLADTGIVGLVWYLALFMCSLVASLGIGDQRTRRFVVAIIVARFIGGFFDRITINGGDVYSLFFIICCSVALTDQSLRKVAFIVRGKAPPLPASLFLPDVLPPPTSSL